jgi:uncharacterized SAM-binding protein YcdF (DUF218 family)
VNCSRTHGPPGRAGYDGRMDPGEFKPLLGALLLPPAGPLLLALLGWLLALRYRAAGALVGLCGLALLWFLSCHAVAVALAQSLLPQPPVFNASAQVQAIVVLGGGALAHAPEWSHAQPTARTLARLRYGARLARATGKPLAFAGGVGWSATGTAVAPEGEVAQQVLREEWGLQARWVDARSRDTHENARLLWDAMRGDGIRRIALVSDASHLPRATLEFERAGFQVISAPTGFITPRERSMLEWLPSGAGLSASREVLREWLALRVARAAAHERP